jgi:hypothetical protein
MGDVSKGEGKTVLFVSYITMIMIHKFLRAKNILQSA